MQAVKDVWIVGDQFLKNHYHAFPMMRDKAIQAKNQPPYLFRYYNMKPYYSTSLTSKNNAFLRFEETVDEALEECDKLPRFIVIIIDKDLLESACSVLNNYVPPEEMDPGIEKIIKWMTSYVDRSVSLLKTDMYHKKPGSATAAEPKYIWLKMLPRKHQHVNKAEFFRYRFNEILENRIASKTSNYILDVGYIVKHDSFNKDAYLRADDTIEFWNKVDKQLEKFDKKKIGLIPVTSIDPTKHITKKTPHQEQMRRRLPTPPKLNYEMKHEYPSIAERNTQPSRFRTQATFEEFRKPKKIENHSRDSRIKHYY